MIVLHEFCWAVMKALVSSALTPLQHAFAHWRPGAGQQKADLAIQDREADPSTLALLPEGWSSHFSVR